MKFYKPLLITLLFIFSSCKLFATHYFGIDLYYTHVMGNNYRVTVVSFGDCSGAVFPSFPNSTPRIHILNGSTEVFTDVLDIEPPKNGIEVTSGCPADLKRTTCVDPDGTVPGVKKFVYSKEFTLPGQATDWRFVYRGEDVASQAGRSNSLTNVSPAGVVNLVATLNNMNAPNSSPRFSTIAAQFYCINTPVVYAPGVTDANGDALVYALVPGIELGGGNVSYKPGYSGGMPLAVAPGTFSFSTITGMLGFTPNMLQKSLVVYKVSEYRNGIEVGSVMREMTMLVAPCINYPPEGYISNASGADIQDSVTVITCRSEHEVAFDINPVDANGHLIKMEALGLPTDAKLNITGNNTQSPKSRFVWNMPYMVDGDYKFQVAYTDDGCPSSTDTQTYIIRIKHDDIYAIATPAECTENGFIKLTGPINWTLWSYKLYEDDKHLYTRQQLLLNTYTESMPRGKYRIEAVNHIGCTAETTVEISSNCYLADLPTAFSPNGDGKNDILLVRGENIKQAHLRIYNRWGQLIFETRDANTGWDGRYKGQDAPVESYAYVLSVLFIDSTSFEKKGNITLLR